MYNNEPLISVIMGAYNCENTIEKAIQSIQNQTYKNWEFIICDDCSSDNTYSIISKIAKEDNRIHVLHNNQNLQLAASLNKCLEQVKGEFVARMDADDESLPERFEKQIQFLCENNEYGCVGSSVIVYDNTGDKYIRTISENPDKSFLKKGVPCWHPTILVRREVYVQLQGYTASSETRRAEDMDFWFRFYKSGYVAHNLLEPLYRYHESIDDYKKRSISAGIQTAKVYLRGFKLLGFKKIDYLYALKPILTSFIPKSILHKFHNMHKSYL